MSSEFPLVTAIMPTRGRPQWASEAVESFLAQTWPHKELVIADDRERPSFPFPLDDRFEGLPILYFFLIERLTIGAKRNLCCSRGRGEILMHWDDDDWSAPTRMEDQAKRLISADVPITGYRSMTFVDAAGGRWFYDGAEKYALGTSLCYRRSWWQSHSFADVNEGEDNAMVYHSPRILCVPAGDLMFARAHPGNTSIKELGKGALWRRL